MGDFIDELRQNPLLLAVGAFVIVIFIVLVHRQVATGTPASTGIGLTPQIDPNTGLPYGSLPPQTINNYTSYPVVQTQTATPAQVANSNYLAFIRAKNSNANVASYDAKYPGVPIRDLKGNVIGTAPYGQSISITGNPIAGSSNLPGTTVGTTRWLPVSTGNLSGWISSFDLTGVQSNALVDSSQSLSIGAKGGLPDVPVKKIVPLSTIKPQSNVKYARVEAWPSPHSSMTGIANAFGLSSARVQALNPHIYNPNLVYPGMTIRIA